MSNFLIVNTVVGATGKALRLSRPIRSRIEHAHEHFRNGQPLTAEERIEELKDRLAELPKAGEHHIWEAFTLLETLSACRQDGRDRRYFREAMDTGAISKPCCSCWRDRVRHSSCSI